MMEGNSQTGKSRGQVNTQLILSAVIGIVVVALLTSFLLPVAINELEGDETVVINSTTGETVEVNAELNTTVTSITAGTDATIELNDTRTSGTTSKTINVGANATYSLDGGDVEVGVEEAQSAGTVSNYTYVRDYAYSDAASGLWGLIGFALILAVFLAALRYGMETM